MTSEAERAAAAARAERAEVRASSHEQRAADMKEQLVSITGALARAQEDLEQVRQRNETAVGALRGELTQAQRQVGVLERRAALAEALEADVQRQVIALNNELIHARSDVEKGRQTVNEAQTAAAANKGERDTMAANLAQVLAVLKNGESKDPTGSLKGRKSGQRSKADGNSKQ